MKQPARRTWLRHCTLLVLGSAAVVASAGASAASQAGAAASGPSGAPVILVLGDSLSAEYGLGRGQGWVALLEQQLVQQKRAATVVNASISGDTTSGGRSRLPALLKKHRPAIVVIELGGNDALRGLPLTMTRDNLAFLARSAREAGARVVVVGMQMPPNYGRQYARDFEALFASVARDEQAVLVPFLLKGVADVPNAEANFQPDRIHPLASAHPKMLANVWPVLRPLLR